MRGPSVAAKYVGATVLTLLLVTLVIVAVQSTAALDRYATLERRLAVKLERMVSMETELVASPLWNLDDDRLQAMLEATRFDDEVRVLAVYAGRESVPLAQVGEFLPGESIDVPTDPASVRQNWLDPLLAALLPEDAVEARLAPAHEAFDRSLLAVRPVVLETDVGTQEIGRLAIGLTRVPGYRQVAAGYRQTLGLLGLLVLAVAVAGLATTAWVVDRPLRRFLRVFREAEASGERHTLEWRSRDEFGDLATAFNTMQVTFGRLEDESRRLAGEIVEKESLLRQFLELIPAAVTIVDLERRLLLGNRVFTDWFATATTLQSGAPLEEQISSESVQMLTELLVQMDKTGQVIDRELVCTTVDGRSRSLLALVFPITDASGAGSGHGVILTDRTESQEARRVMLEAARLSHLGEMSTMVAHELNQPLNIIRLAAGNLARRGGDGQIDPAYMLRKTQRIEEQTQRAAEVIDQMRRFGSAENRGGTRVDPCRCVAEALGIAGAQLRSHDIDVTRELPEACPEVIGDAVELQRALLNLITNARQAMAGTGGGRLHLSVRHEAGTVTLEVTDSGPGIPETLLERVFEPFFTTLVAGEGQGLGLPLVRAIAREFGGTAHAENVPDGGARVSLVLPVAPDGAP